MVEQRKIIIDVTMKPVKHIYLRVHRDGRVTISAPYGTSEKTLQRFIKEKEEWIKKALASLPEERPMRFMDGEVHYLFGVPLEMFVNVDRTAPSACRVEDRKIILSLHMVRTNREKLWTDYCAERLDEVLEVLIRKWAPIMQVDVEGFTIKRVKSRWGSCNTATHELTFSLALASKPIPCIESVVVHELNHLIERPHSPRFHALMTKWLPDWKERRKALNASPAEFL